MSLAIGSLRRGRGRARAHLAGLYPREEGTRWLDSVVFGALQGCLDHARFERRVVSGAACLWLGARRSAARHREAGPLRGLATLQESLPSGRRQGKEEVTRVMDACPEDLLRRCEAWLQLASRPSQRSSLSYGQSRKAPCCAVISCSQPGTQWAEPLRSPNRPRRLVMSTDERKRGEEKVNARQGCTPSARTTGGGCWGGG